LIFLPAPYSLVHLSGFLPAMSAAATRVSARSLALLIVLAVAEAQSTGRRLKITNGCGNAPIWIAQQAKYMPEQQNRMLLPGQSHDFATVDGVASARYWPKMGCDAYGNNCQLGDSGGPGQGCSAGGSYDTCAPPIDTKFEATFHARDAATGYEYDYVDVSFVDGFTLPFKLTTSLQCSGLVGNVLDCSALSFDSCPDDELLSSAGLGPTSLKAVNPNTGRVAGCYSPCTKLTDPKWNNGVPQGQNVHSAGVSPYCCPQPEQTPETCKAGPVKDTQYVQNVHRFCPGPVYGYAYDDAVGTIKCDARTTYEMTFYCPIGYDLAGGGVWDLIRSHFPFTLPNLHLGAQRPNLPNLQLGAQRPNFFTFISASGLPKGLFHRATGNNGVAWLIMACSVAMVTSLVFFAVRKWRRYTYHQVEDAAQAEQPEHVHREPMLA
jgi:hypothetical protein